MERPPADALDDVRVIEASPGRRRGVRIDARWWTLAIVVAAISTWEISARAEWVNPVFFAEPSRSAQALWTMTRDGVLWNDLRASGWRLVRALVIGAGAGAVVGVVLGWSNRLHAVINPLLAVVHPLPKISLYPLFLLVLGLGDAPKVAVIAVSAFFPMVINTVLGVREVNPELLAVARSYRASRSLVLRRVVFPASVPAVLAGARLSFNTAVIVTIAVELVTGGDGIGNRVWIAWQNLRSDQLFATLFVITVVGYASNLLLDRLQVWLSPWRRAR